MLTRKQHELVCFINDRLTETGVSPSFEEMKEALDLKSKSGVHRLISALEERQFIRRLPNRARALEVLCHPAGLGLSPRRITVSTSGLVPEIERLASLAARPLLAVSASPFLRVSQAV